MIKFDLVKNNDLKEGQLVITNGDGAYTTNEIMGTVGHITETVIYIFQNQTGGSVQAAEGQLKLLSSGFKYAKKISRQNKSCYIKISPYTYTQYINRLNESRLPQESQLEDVPF